ncbi:VOC family protein [Cardiobacteriaceae bacterium TAE3-ERU3]|nr:VOC family protein [Cardiobacteriaceae bacterium TAE3-ERU3]
MARRKALPAYPYSQQTTVTTFLLLKHCEVILSIKITALDHFVLTVQDIDASIEFYTRVLGMEAITFGEGRHALRFGRQKINLHQAGQEITPHARVPASGSADVCLLTSTPLTDVLAHLAHCGIDAESDVVPRTGAVGAIESVYLRDPDGNLIEVSRYQ